MKKFRLLTMVALLCATMIVSADAMAQDNKHEISLSYGWGRSSDWMGFGASYVESIVGKNTDVYNNIGPIGLEYHCNVKPTVGVGAIAVFGYNKEKIKLPGNTPAALRKEAVYTIMPSIKFHWLQRDNWGMYSKMALGVSFYHVEGEYYDDNGNLDPSTKATNTHSYINFQASVLGFEAGSDVVRGFAEAGVGEQGFLLAGLRFMF